MLTSKQPISAWAEEDRPREKLMQKGRLVLSDAELVAIILVSGTVNKSALDIAREVLRLAGNNLNELARLSIKELCRVEGIGPAKAIMLTAALELGSRREAADVRKRNKVSTSADAYHVLRHRLESIVHEEFWIILLNRSNKIVSEHRISEGGLTATVADPRKIFSIALEEKASRVILCHNHPSGNLEPSQEDKDLTQKLKAGGKLLDIAVVDHLIIAEKGYFSFADQGIL